MADKLAIVFDGPPSHESGRFVEVELNGASISFGEWQENGEFWELVLPDRWTALAKALSDRDALEAKLSEMEEKYFNAVKDNAEVARINTDYLVELVDLRKQAWWHRMSNEDIAAELSATFDLGLDTTRKIADWILKEEA